MVVKPILSLLLVPKLKDCIYRLSKLEAAALFFCKVVFTWFRLARESAGEEELLALDRVRDTEEKLGKLTCISRYNSTVLLVKSHSFLSP
jgi:hypothetical protein